jgi:hypothetical protein
MEGVHTRQQSLFKPSLRGRDQQGQEVHHAASPKALRSGSAGVGVGGRGRQVLTAIIVIRVIKGKK